MAQELTPYQQKLKEFSNYVKDLTHAKEFINPLTRRFRESSSQNYKNKKAALIQQLRKNITELPQPQGAAPAPDAVANRVADDQVVNEGEVQGGGSRRRRASRKNRKNQRKSRKTQRKGSRKSTRKSRRPTRKSNRRH